MKILVIILICILWVLCGAAVIIEKSNRGEYKNVEKDWKHVVGLVADFLLGPIALIHHKK